MMVWCVVQHEHVGPGLYFAWPSVGSADNIVLYVGLV